MLNKRFQAEILPQEYQLEALSLDSGTTLLLSTGPQGELFLTREAPRHPLGWQRDNIAAAVTGRGHLRGRCRHFAAARSLPVANRPGAIHLAMVVADSHGDHLYLSMSNPAFDACWDKAPVWTACPFDAGPAPARLRIGEVRISDASDERCIVVDVANAPCDGSGDAAGFARYVVRPALDGAPCWQRLRPTALGHGAASAACLGRSRSGGNVDGIYMSGWSGDAVQLAYAPLANPLRPDLPPQARRLCLPGKLAPEVLAACRNMDNTTDLYTIAQGTLFYFSATNQGDRAEALALTSHPLFAGIRRLFAAAAHGRVTIWGMNETGQVIHTCVDDALIAEPMAWSEPVVVLENARAVAPCRERHQVAKALFAQTPDGLVRVARASVAEGWRRAAIAVAAPGSASAFVPCGARPADRIAVPRSLTLAKAARQLTPPLEADLPA